MKINALILTVSLHPCASLSMCPFAHSLPHCSGKPCQRDLQLSNKHHSRKDLHSSVQLWLQGHSHCDLLNNRHVVSHQRDVPTRCAGGGRGAAGRWLLRVLFAGVLGKPVRKLCQWLL
jgi:hypothetical protein